MVSPSIWSNVWIFLLKPSSYIRVLDWVKVFTFDYILQYLCDIIHVLLFVNVSNCPKSHNFTNIVLFVIYYKPKMMTYMWVYD